MADVLPEGGEAAPDIEAQAMERIMNLIMDIPPRCELLHERDCAACDMSDEIAGMIACYWDPNGQWCLTTATDGLPGDSLLTQLGRMVAHVLHRRTPGYRRPSEATIEAAVAEDTYRRRNDGKA